MSGTWREVEGEFVDTSQVLPFEKPTGAYNLTVPNKLPVSKPDPLPMAPRVEPRGASGDFHRPIPSAPPPEVRGRQRIRVIAKRRAPVVSEACSMNHNWEYNDDSFRRDVLHASYHDNSYVWSSLGFVGLVGSIVLAYHLLTRKDRRMIKSRNISPVEKKWVVDAHGTLHLAQVIPDDDEGEDSEIDERSDDGSSSEYAE